LKTLFLCGFCAIFGLHAFNFFLKKEEESFWAGFSKYKSKTLEEM